jgi:hypothetical protein
VLREVSQVPSILSDALLTVDEGIVIYTKKLEYPE